MMPIFLETQRLLLRRFTEADVDNLCNLDSDRAVMRYLSSGTPTPPPQSKTTFWPRSYERFGVWAALGQSNGSFLGWLRWRKWA